MLSDMDLSQKILMVIGYLFLFILMLILIFGIFMDSNKGDTDILDQPVSFPVWMTCLNCPDTTFNLTCEDADDIVECSKCHTSYIVDIVNERLVKR